MLGEADGSEQSQQHSTSKYFVQIHLVAPSLSVPCLEGYRWRGQCRRYDHFGTAAGACNVNAKHLGLKIRGFMRAERGKVFPMSGNFVSGQQPCRAKFGRSTLPVNFAVIGYWQTA
jgi:hypothetical protein